MREISWLSQNRSDSQEGLCSEEWVSNWESNEALVTSAFPQTLKENGFVLFIILCWTSGGYSFYRSCQISFVTSCRLFADRVGGGRAPYIRRNEIREAKWDGSRQLSDKVTTSLVAKVSADRDVVTEPCHNNTVWNVTTYWKSRGIWMHKCANVRQCVRLAGSNRSKTDVPCDTVRRSYQGVLLSEIVTRLYGTRECNFIHASKNSTAFLASVCPKARNANRRYVHISGTTPYPYLTVSVQNADSKTVAPPCGLHCSTQLLAARRDTAVSNLHVGQLM
jgi:hypothetical protein